MKHTFQLADFPNSNFEIETSIWTGKSKLLMNDVLVEQSNEKGRPFLIQSANGEFVKAFPKPSLPDFVPNLEINGVKNQILEKLKWYEYTIGGLPILLLFIGGALGGVIGVLASITSFSIFREEGTEMSKYLKVIGIVVGSYAIYFIIALFLFKMIG